MREGLYTQQGTYLLILYFISFCAHVHAHTHLPTCGLASSHTDSQVLLLALHKAASALCRIPLSGHFCFSLFRVFKLQDTSNIHNLQRHILKAAKLGSESKQLQTHTRTQKKSRRDFTRSSTLFFSSFIRSVLQKDVCLTLPASPL